MTNNKTAANPNDDHGADTTAYNRRLMGNVTRYPVVIGEATGSLIRDHKSGQMLRDYWGDEGVAPLGYNTPEFLGALNRFLESGQAHRLPDVYPSETRWAAAEILCDRTGMDRVFFATSGTEANESAIKLARKFWWDQEGGVARLEREPGRTTASRHLILTLEGNFHGRTGNSMAATDPRVSPYHRWGFGPSAPGYGVLSNDFKQVVSDGFEHGPIEPCWSEVAAIIMAPVLGNNLVHTYPPEFWARLEEVRSRHGVLIIYDDVQAGSGRAGYHATWQHPGCRVKPDIMTLAKGIAMGFPMSAMLARQDVAASFTPGTHFNTFGGSLLMCHMVVEFYKWLDENLEEVREKGQLVRDEFAARDWVESVDGWGMLNAFRPDFGRFGYNGYDFIKTAREKYGVSMATHRPLGPIRFTPPLNESTLDLIETIQKLDFVHRDLVSGS